MKAWETKRRKNPDLRHIDLTGHGHYEWNRPNGEVVHLHDFTPTQVERIHPAFTATDKHLKTDQKLELHIYSKKMGRREKYTGGFYLDTRPSAPWLIKQIAKWHMGIDKDAWGNHAVMHLNRRYLDKEHKQFQAAGITSHELGHAVGPQLEHNISFFDTHIKDTKKAKDFSEAFQWVAPGQTPKQVKGEWKNTGDIDPIRGTYPWMWEMRGDHPGATQSDKEGYATRWRPNYRNTNYHEDFAETYRNLSGVPMDTSRYINKRTGQPFDKDDHLYWEDKNGSRRKYMLKYHMGSTAKMPGTYGDSPAVSAGTTIGKKGKMKRHGQAYQTRWIRSQARS